MESENELQMFLYFLFIYFLPLLLTLKPTKFCLKAIIAWTPWCLTLGSHVFLTLMTLPAFLNAEAVKVKLTARLWRDTVTMLQK